MSVYGVGSADIVRGTQVCLVLLESLFYVVDELVVDGVHYPHDLSLNVLATRWSSSRADVDVPVLVVKLVNYFFERHEAEVKVYIFKSLIEVKSFKKILDSHLALLRNRSVELLLGKPDCHQ